MFPENYPFIKCSFILFFSIILSYCSTSNEMVVDVDRIQPYVKNPAYWQYKNIPVLLLGGSSDDNLFQHISPELDEELDRLIEFGGNYVRCTMSSRDSGNVYPFHQDILTKKFDLNSWNDEYWLKLDNFLKATYNRQIIVQLEIWASYDFYTRQPHFRDGLTAWGRNPFNPRNNINYSERESGLYENFQSTHGTLVNPFFYTVLPLRQPFDFEMKPLLLEYQQKFADKLLSVSLNYDHVLYVIDNETNTDPKWPMYWSQYIRKKAGERNINIEVTEIWDTYDPTDGAVDGVRVQDPATHFFTRRASVSNTLYDPENYSYIDISNHNVQVNEIHYQTGLYVWKEVQKSGIIRPINNTKIYGADESWSGTRKDGAERFWRNIFAGAASARFHRPSAGLGNTGKAMAHIKSMRMLTDSIEIFSCYPANELLDDRSDNEAYCLANNKGEYLLYFPSGGSINLNIKYGNYQIRWFNISSFSWGEPVIRKLPGKIETPNDDLWAIWICKDL